MYPCLPWKRLNKPACSVVPGMPCVCGSSKHCQTVKIRGHHRSGHIGVSLSLFNVGNLLGANMSDSQNAGFGKFVPGFDFLQNLAKGASQTVPQMPNLANWIAPTLNVEELDKRIAELKAVHFWLDQNSKALGATVQALEVQKMTLATLKGMNFNIGDMANALKLKAADTVYS